MALSREDDAVLVPRELCAIAPRPKDGRSPNEHTVERGVEPLDLKVRLERLALPPERVAVYGHVHEPEEPRLRLLRLGPGVLREEDAAGARPHDWHRLVRRAARDLVEQAELHEELLDRRALSARIREAVHARKVLWSADRDRLAFLAVLLHRPRDRVDVFAHIALDADDADSHRMDLGRRPIKTISNRRGLTGRRDGRFNCSPVPDPDGCGTVPARFPRTRRNRRARGAGLRRC